MAILQNADARSANNVVISTFTSVHAKEVSNLLTEAFPVRRDEVAAWFRHWWIDNPIRNELTPRGWVALADGEVVGFTANIRLPYVIDGADAVCCATGATAVRDDWQGRGVARQIGSAFVRQRNPPLLLAVDAIPAAERLWGSLGMQSLRQHWLERNHRLVASFASLAELARRTSGIRVHPSMPGLLDYAAKFLDTKPVATVELRETPLTVDDGLLAQVPAQNFSIYARRDRAILNWMVFGTPYLRRTRRLFIARSGRTILGYLILKERRQRAPAGYYLLEARTVDSDPGVMKDLLVAARTFARQASASDILVRAYTPVIDEAASDLLGLTRTTRPLSYQYLSNIGPIDTDRWEATSSDGDLAVN
jgi:GNAT superfamily N-acetyltransferase